MENISIINTSIIFQRFLFHLASYPVHPVFPIGVISPLRGHAFYQLIVYRTQHTVSIY